MNRLRIPAHSPAMLLGLLVIVSITLLQAAGGSLDLTFSGTGKVRTSFADLGVPSNFGAAVNDVLTDPTGRIIAVGEVVDPACDLTGPSCPYAIGMARYNPGGSLDPTFGSGGKVVSTFHGSEYVRAHAGAIDHQGRIVLAGQTDGDLNGQANNFGVFRYLPNGAVDTSFGVTGRVSIDFGGDLDFGWGVAIQEDGRIVVAGQARVGGDYDFAVVRLNSDGSLDDTFAGDGRLNIGFGADDAAYGLTIDRLGRIVLSGVSGSGIVTGEFGIPNPPNTGRFALARVLPDGTLDSSFGDGGRVVTKVTPILADNVEVARSLVVDSSDRILAAGYVFARVLDEKFRFVVARYLDDGTLDNLFGSGGKVMFGEGALTDVAVDASGRPVLAGFRWKGPGTFDWEFSVLRLTDDGALDTTFGTGGGVVTDFGSGEGVANAVAVDTSGRILAGGSDGSNAFVLARYHSDPAADLSITKTVQISTAIPGDVVTYTLRTFNSGPDTSANVGIVDTLPAGLSPVSCSSPAGVCTINGQTVTITYSALASLGERTATISARLGPDAADGAVISNTASVTSVTPDPRPVNNVTTASFTVRNRADLLLTQKVKKLSNRQLAFAISVKNVGPYEARGIIVENPMPNGTTFLGVDSGDWACEPLPPGSVGTLVCSLASLPSSGTTTATLVFDVKATASGNSDIVNVASVRSATYDPNLSNNTATLVTRVSGK